MAEIALAASLGDSLDLIMAAPAIPLAPSVGSLDSSVAFEATQVASSGDSLDSIAAATAVKMVDLGNLPVWLVDSPQTGEVEAEEPCY